MKFRLMLPSQLTGASSALAVTQVATLPALATGPLHETDAMASGDHSHDHVHRSRSSAKLSAHQHHHPHLADLTADTDLNGHSHALPRVQLPWENAAEEVHDGSYLDPDVPAPN
jgi:hypothetical protein